MKGRDAELFVGSSYLESLDTPNLKFDPVDKPMHYNTHPSGVEPIVITEHMNFCLGNCIKYIMRFEKKNGVEDLKKARWYLDREIQRREREAKDMANKGNSSNNQSGHSSR